MLHINIFKVNFFSIEHDLQKIKFDLWNIAKFQKHFPKTICNFVNII
jgi:hypothetical protein